MLFIQRVLGVNPRSKKALAKYRDLSEAVLLEDVPTPTQLQTLRDAKVDADVTIEKGEGNYDDKNKAEEFYPCSFKPPLETENPAVEEEFDDSDIPF